MGWSPAETLQQHEGWPADSHVHQATEHLFRDPLIGEATMEGAVTQALQWHLPKLAEDPNGAAVHLQLEAVRRAAAQMVHDKHLLLTHTEQLTDPTCASLITMPCMTQKSHTRPPPPSACLQDTTRAPQKTTHS